MRALVVTLFFAATLLQARVKEVPLSFVTQLRIGQTSGRVYLSGSAHASGNFRCDSDFLQGGKVYFNLNEKDYVYSLGDILQQSQLPRRLASESGAWKVEMAREGDNDRYLLISRLKEFPVRKIEILLDDQRSLRSFYVDFGTHNLAFFPKNS